eukprot:jgi/Chlat1/1943/Chrsp153S02249
MAHHIWKSVDSADCEDSVDAKGMGKGFRRLTRRDMMDEESWRCCGRKRFRNPVLMSRVTIMWSLPFPHPLTFSREGAGMLHLLCCAWIGFRQSRLADEEVLRLVGALLLLAVIIAVVTILTWLYTQRYARSAVNEVSFLLRRSILQRTESRIQNLLVSASQDVSTAAYTLGSLLPDISWGSVRTIGEKVCWSYFISSNTSLAFGIATLEGLGFLYSGTDPTNYQLLVYNITANGATSNRFEVDARGRAAQLLRRDSNASSTLTTLEGQDWWQSSLTGDTNVSVSIVASPTLNTTLLLIASTIKNGDGFVLGITGATVSLEFISTYIRSLQSLIDLNGKMFVMSGDGLLIASSHGATTSSVGGVDVRIPATSSEDRVVRQAAEYLEHRYTLDGLKDANETFLDGIIIDNQSYYIDFGSAAFYDLGIVVVTVLPRASILGQFDHNGKIVVAVIAGVAFGIFVISVILTVLFTASVSNERANKLRELQELNAELFQAKMRAEESSRIKSAFLLNMSHELRTPMAGILGFLEVLLADALSLDQRATVTHVQRCASELLQILNDILDIGKVESGRMVLDLAHVDVVQEISAVVDLFAVQTDAKNVELILQLSDNIPPCMLGDSMRIRQIFTNLLSNSVKFTQAGYIMVRGHKMHEDLEKQRVTVYFEVDDTGVGIPHSQRAKVFESFVQADNSTTRNYGGTGLGLGIARSLVALMDGSINIVDKDGPGTLMAFQLTLGIVSESADTVHTIQRSKIPAAVAGQQILLAMQHPISLSVTAEWLRNQGLLVLQASTWEDMLRQTSLLQGKCLLAVEPRLIGTSKDGVDTITEAVVELAKVVPEETCMAFLISFTSPSVLRKALYRGLGKRAVVINKPLHLLRMMELLERWVADSSPLANDRPPGCLKELMPDADATADAPDGRDPSQAGGLVAELPATMQPLPLLPGEQSGKQLLQSHHEQPEKKGGLRAPQALQVNLSTSEHSDPGPPSVSSQPSPDRSPAIVHSSPATTKPSGSRLDPNALRECRILVAEDNVMNQRWVRAMLEKMGATVAVVDDGSQAVAAVTERSFDIILMDCAMPVQDGYQATAEIRKLEKDAPKQTPIVALTAHALASDRDHCLEVGMNDYLCKPVNASLLVSTIKRLVGPHRDGAASTKSNPASPRSSQHNRSVELDSQIRHSRQLSSR